MTTTDTAVDAVAVYRLTRLVTADTITLPIRSRIIRSAYRRAIRQRRLPLYSPTGGMVTALEDQPDAWQAWHELAVEGDEHPPALAKLVTCRWCASIWLAAGAVLARRLTPRTWDMAARALTASAAAALLAKLEDDE